MNRIVKRLRKALRSSQKGFTLIELLVVLGILGVIGGIVALNVGQFIGRGCTESANIEKHNVSTAALAALADRQPAANYANYLTGTVKGTYTVTTDGQVTQTATGCE